MPKQPIIVTITRTRRKAEDQPWTVTIAEPRKQPYTLKGRYARKDSAKRGAVRHLNAWKGPSGTHWINGPKRAFKVEFLFKRK
jgi:hypothetical protein